MPWHSDTEEILDEIRHPFTGPGYPGYDPEDIKANEYGRTCPNNQCIQRCARRYPPLGHLAR